MKKHLFIGLCALFSAVGCSESEVDDPIGGNGGTDGGELYFTAGVNSRVSADNDLVWGLYDRVGISVSGDADNNNVQYQITEVVDGASVLEAISDALEVDNASNETFYAYYPYKSAGESFDVDLTANCTTPLLRAVVANPADNNISLPFTHQYAKLVFSIDAVDLVTDLTGATATLVGANATATYDASTGLFSNEATGTITTDVVVGSSIIRGTVTMYVVPTTLTNNASITITVDGVPYEKAIPDQALEGNSSNPYTLTVGGDAISYIDIPTSTSTDSVDNTILKSDEGGSIERLLAQFRRCVATYQGEVEGNGAMQIKYLDDEDSTKYADGSAAALPTLDTTVSSTDSDVMVYFPEYWYKYDADATEDSYCRYYISDSEKAGYVHVEESLVGAYKANIYSNKLYSCVASAATDKTGLDTFKSSATARGTGYQLIDFEQHSTIAMMLFAKYETRNIPDVLGRGSAHPGNGVDIATGSSNSTGIKDSENTTSGYVVGLGLEGVYGGYAEFVQGVTISETNRWTITDHNGNTREVQAASNHYIRTLACNNRTYADTYFDVVPTTVNSGAAVIFGSRYVANEDTQGDLPMCRSYANDGAYGGVVYAGVNKNATNDSGVTAWSTRLAFRGTITVAEESDNSATIGGWGENAAVEL